MLTKYKTVEDEAFAEYEINKSRFIAAVKRVDSEEAAAAYINSIRKKYWDATHNCSAYIIGEKGGRQKADDDGEPSGTAGRPILDVLQKQAVSDTAIVVTRYFGGIKLGAGGLVRAYGRSASLVLEKAVIVERTPFEKTELFFDYGFAGSIENYFRKNNFCIANKEYTDSIKFTVFLAADISEEILESITDMTAGRCDINRLGQVYRDVPL